MISRVLPAFRFEPNESTGPKSSPVKKESSSGVEESPSEPHPAALGCGALIQAADTILEVQLENECVPD